MEEPIAYIKKLFREGILTPGKIIVAIIVILAISTLFIYRYLHNACYQNLGLGIHFCAENDSLSQKGAAAIFSGIGFLQNDTNPDSEIMVVSDKEFFVMTDNIAKAASMGQMSEDVRQKTLGQLVTNYWDSSALVPAKTNVEILQVLTISPATTIAQIKILSGEQVGRVGWVFSYYVKTN